jgi:hypothetical protein
MSSAAYGQRLAESQGLTAIVGTTGISGVGTLASVSEMGDSLSLEATTLLPVELEHVLRSPTI